VNTGADRSANHEYDFPAVRIRSHDIAQIVRSAWLRGVAAGPNLFARESFVDEMAFAAGADPLAFRLRHLKDERSIAVLKTATERFGWEMRPGARALDKSAEIVRGRGLAYAQTFYERWPGAPKPYGAWAVEVEVNRKTGNVRVLRVVASQDAGIIINPIALRQQAHGQIIQAISRSLKEEVSIESGRIKTSNWADYPILRFPELPEIDVVLINRPEEPPLGGGDAIGNHAGAAIANAIFDATGVRMRRAPFTPDRMRNALSSSAA
jgi:nicotinate dehydrogenase subunit B